MLHRFDCLTWLWRRGRALDLLDDAGRLQVDAQPHAQTKHVLGRLGRVLPSTRRRRGEATGLQTATALSPCVCMSVPG